jgi:hypothetical protein
MNIYREDRCDCVDVQLYEGEKKGKHELREKRLNEIRRKRLGIGKGDGKGQRRSQILEYIMVLWFNGFQTTGTLCNKEINRYSNPSIIQARRTEGRMPRQNLPAQKE